MTETDHIYPCLQCGVLNRIAAASSATAVRCGRCKKPVFPGFSVPITDASFNERVLKCPLPVLVDFWAAWCAPCRMLAPTLERLADTFRGRVLIAKVDVDQNQQLASRFQIRSIPTMIMFRGGELVDTMQGAASEQDLITRCNRLLQS